MDNGQRPLPSFPFRVEFEVTGVCNLNCVYCYASPLSSLNPPFEKLEYLFKKTKDEANPFEVAILGGEPFVRKDIIDIFEKAQSIFDTKKIGVSTNGTLLDRLNPSEVSRLKDLSNRGFSFQVTLDSVNPKVNDSVRGRGKDTLSGLNVLERAEIPFVIGICLTTANRVDVVDSVRQLLHDYSSLAHINLMPLQPFSTLGEKYSHFHLDGKDMRGIYDRVSTAIKDAGRRDVTVSGVIDQCENIKDSMEPLINTYGFKCCLAGLTRAGVYPDGGVSPCTTLRDSAMGNLYLESWAEIWSRARDRFEKLTIVGSQCHAYANKKQLVSF